MTEMLTPSVAASLGGAHRSNSFFGASLVEVDPDIARAVELELGRQRDEIELIASENIVSRAVLEAQGSVMTNKYAEGYPGRRYYGGCQFVDIAETLAIDRAKALFGCGFANVQPNSGSQANQAVFLALLQPGDTFMGLDLAAGGHLTHGSPVNMSGRWFKPESYGVDPDTHIIDMDAVEAKAKAVRPKLIIAGGSAYSRFWDFARFRAICDEVGALFLVDMAHFAGLVAGGVHPSPFPHAHVVTSTTHKTLRGPRGGLILTDDEALAKKINSAIFPGLQGGPLMHVIAGKAVAFGEALKPGFKAYAQAVVDNAKALAASVEAGGLAVVSGQTDNHLMLVDLRPMRLTGKAAEAALGRAHITVNKNGIPFDPEKPMVTSGIRIGTPAATSRGFGTEEFRTVGSLIVETLNGLSSNGEGGNAGAEAAVREKVAALTQRFRSTERHGMFTGLISDVGTIVDIVPSTDTTRVRIACGYAADGIALGASIACSGPCLTAVAVTTEAGRTVFDIEAGRETLERTTLGAWQTGQRINLERSLKIGDELGGHLVSGHIDGIATVLARTQFGNTARFDIEAPAALARFIAEKGSVSLDGTSLTVNSVEGNRFAVLLIPHSLTVTTWDEVQAGTRLNLEIDQMARYAARLAETAAGA